MDEQMRVRVNFASGEIDLAGPPATVREWWTELADDIAAFRNRGAAGYRGPFVAPAGEKVARVPGAAMPSSFGEYLHNFPSSVTDIERALIAGFFIQSQSDNNSFTTANVNELLIANSVRLANASNSVKRNIENKRIFPLGGGQFRVSQIGIDHLTKLSGNSAKEPQ